MNSLESEMNQRCTDPPALRHDVMRSVKMEERKRSGLKDYSVACRSLACMIGYVVSYASCASLVTCDRQNQNPCQSQPLIHLPNRRLQDHSRIFSCQKLLAFLITSLHTKVRVRSDGKH